MIPNSVILISFLCFYTSIKAITNIKHAIACESQKMDLNCDDDEKITILYANYGRTSLTVCRHSDANSINCYSQNTVLTLKAICEGEQQCSVQALNDVFGDPCWGINKYLFVMYSCVAQRDTKTAVTCVNKHVKLVCDKGQLKRILDAKHATACEEGMLQLKCGDNEQITILHANYGRTSSTVCLNSNIHTIKCYNRNTVPTVKNICEGEQQCSVHSSNRVFGDPCYGTHKYLFVLYRCADPKDFKTELPCENDLVKLGCEKGQVVRILDINYGRKPTQPDISG